MAGAEADYHQQQPLSVPPAIEELVEQYEAAVRALNAEAVASLYAEDGTHITGGGEAVQGPAALQAHYERNFPLFELLDLDIEFEELESTADWAFGRALIAREGKMKNGRAGADVALSAVVLKRVDGVWKIHWDMVGPGVGERPPEER